MQYIGVGRMYNDTQFMKGILEGCILKVLSSSEMYGYRAVEIIRTLGFDVNEATVYPILLRLQNKGLLKAERRPSPLGPDRKYFSLTKEGEKSLMDFKESWLRFRVIVNNVMEAEINDL